MIHSVDFELGQEWFCLPYVQLQYFIFAAAVFLRKPHYIYSGVCSKVFKKKVLAFMAHTDPGVLDEDDSLKGHSELVCS